MSPELAFRSDPMTPSRDEAASLSAGFSRAKPAESAGAPTWMTLLLSVSVGLWGCGGGGSPSAPGPGADRSRFLGEWVGTYTDSNGGGTGNLTLDFQSLDAGTEILEGSCAFEFEADGRNYSVRQGRLTASGGGTPERIVLDCLVPGGCGVHGNGELVNDHALGGVVTASVPATCAFARTGQVDLTRQ